MLYYFHLSAKNPLKQIKKKSDLLGNVTAEHIPEAQLLKGKNMSEGGY